MIALFFQLAVFTAYVAFVWRKYGMLYSISDSYYYLDTKYNGLFAVFCMSLSFPMFAHSKMFHESLATQTDYTWLFFLSMMLAFTGVASEFKRNGESSTIHMIGVFVSTISALLGLGLQYNIWFPLGAVVIGTIVLLFQSFTDKFVWWLEIWTFICIFVGLIELYF